MANKGYTDRAKNAFQKTNLFYTASPFLGTQDPTVFGFKLFFHFDNPASPLLFGANRDIQSAPVNTAARFLLDIKDDQRLFYLEKFIYLLSNINQQTPWYFQSLNGLKDAWMQNLNEPLMKDKKLEIDCLEAIDLRVTAMMDLYRKACFDWKNRREVIPENLRRFRLSVFVYEARWINNPNAISFSASGASDRTQQSYDYNDDPVPYGYGGNIFGEAAKKNAELTSRLTGSDETSNDPSTSNVNILEGVPMSTTRNLFHFDYCTFNMSEPEHLNTISNAEPSDVVQKFVINYADVEEENMYNYWTSTDPISDAYVRTLDKAALDDPNIQGQTPGVPGDPLDRPTVSEQFNLFDKIKQAGAAKMDDIAKQAEAKWNKIKEEFSPGNMFNDLTNRGIAEAEDAVSSRLNNLFLGNIYGFSASSAVNAALGGGIIGAAGEAIRQGGNPLDAGPSVRNTGTSNINQNINEGSPSLANDDDPNSFPTDNIFE